MENKKLKYILLTSVFLLCTTDIHANKESAISSEGINIAGEKIDTKKEKDKDAKWSFNDSEDEEDDELDYDPLEPYNRLMFKINNAIDMVFVSPIAMAYKHVLPKFLQIGIENFTSNFFAPVKTINFVLQGDSEYATKTFFRFIVNSLFGFFGTADVAKIIGLDGKSTCFGDTLKKWGAKPGPYIVLPIFGSTSLRGAAGMTMQLPMDPLSAEIALANYKKRTRTRLYYTIYGVDLLAKRAGLITLMKELEQTSNDMYVTVRRAVMSLERA